MTHRLIPSLIAILALTGCTPESDFHAIDHDGDGFNRYQGDCDDDNDNSYPDAPEVCDGLDNDCDGTVDEGISQTLYLDADGDGFGDESATFESCDDDDPRYVGVAGDCDDTNAQVFPEAHEQCDEIDNDCDGDIDEDLDRTWYLDDDSDGWGDDGAPLETCAPPADYVQQAGDCDDHDALVNPDAADPCRDGVDQDCSGEDSFCLVEQWETLPGDAGLALYGTDSKDTLGSSVASLGDLNGDGADEFLLAAPQHNGEAANTGIVWIGSMPERVEGSVTLPDTTGALELLPLTASTSGTRLADSAAVGDLDGDGRMDLILGASSARGSQSSTGAAYIFLADSLEGALSTGEEQSVEEATLELLGDQRGSNFGHAITPIGDWTGDGYPDLMVSAPALNESYRSRRGAVYLVATCEDGAGSACGADGEGASWGGSLTLADEATRLLGHDARDELGAAIVSLGNFYDDGREVVAIGAPGADGVGAVYLMHQDSAWAGSDPEDEAVLILRGLDEDGRLGEVLTRVPDMDGDGRDDLVVGVPGSSEALVLYSDGRVDGERLTRDDADLMFLGPVGSATGSAVAGGDFDGDGLFDLILGAPDLTTDGGSGAGGVYIYFGDGATGATGSVLLADLSETPGGGFLGASDRRSSLGGSLAAGDFDGDGSSDVLVGASAWDTTENGSQDAGAGFVLYGGSVD